MKKKRKVFLTHLKKVVDFKVGDLVSVLIPKIDRSGTDTSRLPVKIIDMKIHSKLKKYQVLSDFGVLDIWYGAADLTPTTFDDNCPENLLEERFSLHAAAYKFNNRTIGTGRKCNCRQSCLSNSCSCKKQNFACTNHCHPFSKNCLNNDQSMFAGNNANQVNSEK